MSLCACAGQLPSLLKTNIVVRIHLRFAWLEFAVNGTVRCLNFAWIVEFWPVFAIHIRVWALAGPKYLWTKLYIAIERDVWIKRRQLVRVGGDGYWSRPFISCRVRLPFGHIFVAFALLGLDMFSPIFRIPYRVWRLSKQSCACFYYFLLFCLFKCRLQRVKIAAKRKGNDKWNT